MFHLGFDYATIYKKPSNISYSSSQVRVHIRVIRRIKNYIKIIVYTVTLRQWRLTLNRGAIFKRNQTRIIYYQGSNTYIFFPVSMATPTTIFH